MKRIFLLAIFIIILGGFSMLFGCTNNSNYSKEIIESIHSNDYDKFEKLLSKSKNLNLKVFLKLPVSVFSR